MKYCLITLVSLFLVIDVSLANSSPAARTDFLKKFPLKEGHYDTLVDKKTKVDFCENEELDIVLRETDGELALTIGPRLVFPDLQKTESISEVEKNCVVKTTNTLTKDTLKQVITETCNKKQTYHKTHVLRLEGDTIRYDFSTPGHKVESCKYKFLALKQGSL